MGVGALALSGDFLRHTVLSPSAVRLELESANS